MDNLQRHLGSVAVEALEHLYGQDYSYITNCLEMEAVACLITLGGTQEDEGYVTFPLHAALESVPTAMLDKKKFGLVVFTTFLDYYDGGRWVKKMWAEVRFDVPDDVAPIDAGRFIMANITNKLPIRMFRDEDALLGTFRKKYDGNNSISFFINPAYPDGSWHNHTL